MNRHRMLVTAGSLIVLSCAPAWSQPVTPPSPVQPREGHIVDYHSREQKNVAPSPDIPQPPTEKKEAPQPLKVPEAPREVPRPATVTPVDETSLWKLLRQQRYQKLRQEIHRLRQAVPTWTPPKKLLTELREGETRQALTRAIAQQHWAAVVALSRRTPHFFTCRQVYTLWALADAYHALGQPGEVLAVYQRIIPTCERAADRLVTLRKAQSQLPPEAVDTLLRREAQIAKDEQTQQAFTDVRYAVSVSRLSEAVNAQAFAKALTFEEPLRANVQRKRDANVAALFGWSHFHERHWPQAADWFAQALTWDSAQEDAAYGLALTRLEQGDLRGAETLARPWANTSAKLRSVLGDALFARAQESRTRQQYRESLELARESEQYRPARRDTRALKAWNAYELGETAQAAAEFAALYRSQPDDESAQGVFYSSVREKNWAELEELVRSVPGPLTPLWSAHQGQRYYDQKLFLLAEQTAQEKFPHLRNLDTPTLTSGIALRYKSGTQGLGKLEVETLPLAEGTLVYDGVHSLSLRLHRVALDSGRLAANALIGSFPRTPAPYRVRPTTRLVNGVEPYLSYAREGWLAPYAEFGLTPSDGEVPSKPIWRLGVVQRQEFGRWHAELFSQPVRESLLSYTGIVDPYSGKKWGGIRQTGGQFSVYRGLNQNWGWSGQASMTVLRGHTVPDNYHLALGAGVARTFTPHGFAYLAVGPRAAFDHYQKNLSQFTLGHGGYFSPHHLFQFSVAANFLTQEARRFIVRGDVSAGFQVHREDSSPFLPFHPDGRRYPAINDSGPVFSTELTGVWQVSDRWQIGGGFIARKTANYDDRAVMVFVRFLFAPRPAVLSTDLPASLLYSLYSDLLTSR